MGDKRFDVEKLIRCETIRGEKHYRVKWKDYSIKQATWELANALPPRIIQEYNGKHLPAKKPLVTDNILKLCDKPRELKQRKNPTEGAKLYREANHQVKKKRHEKSKGDIDWRTIPRYRRKPAEKQQQESLPTCESSKQGRTTTVQDKAGKCLTEEQDILKRWTECCSELYTHTTTGDPKVLDVSPPINNDSDPILREVVEVAVKINE